MSYNLFLDDIRYPMTTKHVTLPNLEWKIVRSYNDFVKTINENGLPSYIAFDHDLAYEHYQHGHETGFQKFDYSNVKEKTGYDCAKFLVEYCIKLNLDVPKYIVHSMNPVGKENIISLLESYKKSRKM